MQPINFTLNIGDLFTEESTEDGYVELNIGEALKSSLIDAARDQARKLIQPKVDELILAAIGARLDLIIPAMVEAALERFQESKEFKGKYGEAKNLDQVIIERLAYGGNFHDKLASHVDAAAKKYSEEIKKNYDSRFAAGIVEGLNKHNLLNSDAAKILLTQ